MRSGCLTRAREGDALAFAGAEAVSGLIPARGKAEAVEKGVDHVGRGATTSVGESGEDILADGEVREKMEELEHESDGPGAEGVALRGRQGVDVLVA
jgi:hypothetical protein